MKVTALALNRKRYSFFNFRDDKLSCYVSPVTVHDLFPSFYRMTHAVSLEAIEYRLEEVC